MNPEEIHLRFEKLRKIARGEEESKKLTPEELDRLADLVNPNKPEGVDPDEIAKHYEFEPKKVKPFVPPPTKKKDWLRKWEDEHDQ